MYLNTMCDGEINHLHLQLLPRYAGDPIGSTRFVAERRPITDGDETTKRIHERLGFALLGRPYTFVNVHDEVKQAASGDVGMIAPVCSPALFEHVLHGTGDLALGPEQGYW